MSTSIFIRKSLYSSTESCLTFHDSSIKTFLRPSLQNFELHCFAYAH